MGLKGRTIAHRSQRLLCFANIDQDSTCGLRSNTRMYCTKLKSSIVYLRPENGALETRNHFRENEARVKDLEFAVRSGKSKENAQSVLDLAGIYCWRGKYRQTYDLLSSLLDVDLPDNILFEARQLIADNYFRHDQYDCAHRIYSENLDAARRCGDPYWIARSKDGIAWVLIDVGHYTSSEFQEAWQIFAENLAHHRKTGATAAEAMSLYGLSRASAGMGKYDRAIELANQSIEHLEAHGGHHLIQLPILQIANVHRDRGSFEMARPFYERAVVAADRSQDPYLQALTAYHYGCLLVFVGEIEEARQLWQTVLPWIAELEFPRLGSETCARLARLAADQGDFEQAYKLQMESQQYGSRVGVISPILQNQQLLMRTTMDRAKRLEEELTYLMAGIEASEDGIFVLGSPESGIVENDFLIQFVNDAAARMLGRTPLSIAHVLLKTIWQSPTSNDLLEPSLEVYASGERRTLDPIRLEFSEGNPRWYAVKIAKISNGIAWTLSDVSERETMRLKILAQRDSLEEANLKLKELDKEKSEMLGIAAHDLRSPIANIRSLSDLIDSNDPKVAELTGLIQFSADALLTLLENLLDIERIEQGRLDLEVRTIDLNHILDHSIQQMSSEASQKGIKIDRSGDPLRVQADESAAIRVFLNLISNAVKFSTSGTTVSVVTSNNGKRGRIEIRDQGPGISSNDLKKLFVKFARLSARPTAGESSTGLGLSIVKSLVEAMHGEVGCESICGEGSMFWVELPSVEGF